MGGGDAGKCKALPWPRAGTLDRGAEHKLPEARRGQIFGAGSAMLQEIWVCSCVLRERSCSEDKVGQYNIVADQVSLS